MRVYVPDYYPEFCCIAEKCRHSCCVGWEIDIDEESLARFKTIGGEIGRRLKEDIIEGEDGASFRLKPGDRCPFLNERGLCDLIIELGEESLCQICADHPRFRSFFTGRVEMGLGLCCEEAARIVLSWEEKARWIVWEDDGWANEMPEEEREIMEMRDALVKMMQRRDLPVELRVERMLDAAGIVWPKRGMAQWAEFLLGLERMDENWAMQLEALRASDGLPQAKTPENAWEQLMVYFLMRHMPGALEDGDMQGRLMMCVLLWEVVRAMTAMGMELLEAARMCSAEIEYSDENISAILDEMAALGLQG